MPTLSGLVKDSADSPIGRCVRVYRQDTGAFVGQTNSDAGTGAWSVTTADTRKHFAVELDGVADLNWADLSLLIYGNGANGGTTFTEETGKAISLVGTGPITSTAQSQFGGSSLYLPGTASNYLTIDGSSSAFTLGTGDFTISGWFYVTSFPSTKVIIDWRTNGGAELAPFVYLMSSGALLFGDTTNTVTSAATFTANQWNHFEITRSGTTVRLFLNGVLDANTLTDSVNLVGGTSDRPCLAYGSNPASTSNFGGYLNSLAVYKGWAAHTATFTPPAVRTGDLTTPTFNGLIYDNLTPT